MHSSCGRFNLVPNVIRVPIVPGSDPRVAYGQLIERGVRGVVLEAFGVGNMPDLPQQGWMPWLRQQTRDGLQVGARSIVAWLGSGSGTANQQTAFGRDLSPRLLQIMHQNLSIGT